MESKDYSIEDIIVYIHEILLLLKRKWYIILLTAILCVFSLLTFNSKSYSASSALFLKKNKNSSLLLLASNFGIGSEPQISFDKIKSVGESDLIYYQILETHIKVNKDSTTVLNYFIKSMGWGNLWEKHKPSHVDLDSNQNGFERDSIKKEIISAIKLYTSISENSEKLIIIETNHQNQYFAAELNKALVTKLVSFFNDLKIIDDLKTKAVLQTRLDSITNKLLEVEDKYASLSDQSFMTVKVQGMLKQKRAERELLFLNEMYIQIMKQFELISFKILDKKPSIFILKSPKYPLKMTQRSVLISITLGILLGVLISTSLILITNRIKTVLKTKNSI